MHLPCCWRRARWFNAHRSLRPFYEAVSITLYVCLSVVVTRAVSANGLIFSPLDKKGNCFPADIDKIIEITKLLCFILLCFFFHQLIIGFRSLNVNVQRLALFEQNINKSYYRSGTVNSNTVNSKFHLIRSCCEYLARFLSFHV